MYGKHCVLFTYSLGVRISFFSVCVLKWKFVVHLFVSLLHTKTKSFKHFPVDFRVMGYLEFILPHISFGCLHQLIYAWLGTCLVILFYFQSLYCYHSDFCCCCTSLPIPTHFFIFIPVSSISRFVCLFATHLYSRHIFFFPSTNSLTLFPCPLFLILITFFTPLVNI